MRGIVKTEIKRPGFTLLELLVVIMIMVLFATVAAPSLTKLVKTNRVKQTASIVLTALNKARDEAVRSKRPVAVFYGDDPTRYQNIAGLWAPPLSVDLPLNNQIEIWAMHVAVPLSASDCANYNDATENWVNDGVNCMGEAPCEWSTSYSFLNLGYSNLCYPYCVRSAPITVDPLVFPDGVRIIACTCIPDYDTNGNPPWLGYQNTGSFNSYYGGATALYEVKRHNSVYNSSGALSTPYGDAFCFNSVLIYDLATGEHIVIRVAEWESTSRPRIVMDSSAGTTYTLYSSSSSGAQVGTSSLMGWKIYDTHTSSHTLTSFNQIDEWMSPP